jgi:hypothetical protein
LTSELSQIVKRLRKKNRVLIPQRGRRDHQAGNHTSTKVFNLPSLRAIVNAMLRYNVEVLLFSGSDPQA